MLNVLIKKLFSRKMHKANFILNVNVKKIPVLNLIGILSCSRGGHSSKSRTSSCLLSLFQLSVLYSFVSLLIIVPQLLTATGIIRLTSELADHSAGFYIRLTYVQWAHFQSVTFFFSLPLHLFKPRYQATVCCGSSFPGFWWIIPPVWPKKL